MKKILLMISCLVFVGACSSVSKSSNLNKRQVASSEIAVIKQELTSKGEYVCKEKSGNNSIGSMNATITGAYKSNSVLNIELWTRNKSGENQAPHFLEIKEGSILIYDSIGKKFNLGNSLLELDITPIGTVALLMLPSETNEIAFGVKENEKGLFINLISAITEKGETMSFSCEKKK